MTDNFPVTVHMVVKNEDRFIWYAVQSVLPYVRKVDIIDTGSTDRTSVIIPGIKNRKISFRGLTVSRPEDLASVRQKQLDETITDWIWIVDGDEIYSESLAGEIISLLRSRGNNLEGIVVGKYDLLGDIYHAQHASVGSYTLFGTRGHFVLRLINRKAVNGLHVEGIYPYEGYYDRSGKEITQHDRDRFVFTEGRMYHAMYLQRSSRGTNLSDTMHRKKFKYDEGFLIGKNKDYPEVFDSVRPVTIPDVRNRRSSAYEWRVKLTAPVKKIKRTVFGYW